jgi:N-acylglucosamine-6-phosphate 2-epimerase
MAEAAMRGGASGIRANSVDDITEIMGHVPLPVIGIIKKIVPGSQVYITPTRSEVDALAKIGVPIIAMDATSRERPDKIPLSDSFPAIRKTYPDILFMADCATYEDGLRARELGFDIVGTTLCGYTEETKGTELPHYELIEQLVKNLSVPVAAEGGIWTPEHMKKAFYAGAHFCVVGTAITRPMHITRRFVEELP